MSLTPLDDIELLTLLDMRVMLFVCGSMCDWMWFVVSYIRSILLLHSSLPLKIDSDYLST